MYMLQKNRENCKESKGNNKVQTRSQDNTLTISAQYMYIKKVCEFQCSAIDCINFHDSIKNTYINSLCVETHINM